eukprot:m.101635 g.101635  ORF g.101635 m.101635 type:complete len:66 (+) comp22294_c1_seq4:593-790(+)
MRAVRPALNMEEVSAIESAKKGQGEKKGDGEETLPIKGAPPLWLSSLSFVLQFVVVATSSQKKRP